MVVRLPFFFIIILCPVRNSPPSLATLVGRPLAASLLFDYPSVEALVNHLTDLLGPPPDVSRSLAAGAGRGASVGEHAVYVTAGAARFPRCESLAAFEVPLIRSNSLFYRHSRRHTRAQMHACAHARTWATAVHI